MMSLSINIVSDVWVGHSSRSTATWEGKQLTDSADPHNIMHNLLKKN